MLFLHDATLSLHPPLISHLRRQSLFLRAPSPGCVLFRNNQAFYAKHSGLLVLFLKWVKLLPPLQLPVAALNTHTRHLHLFFLPMSVKPDFKWLKSPQKRSWNVTCCEQYIDHLQPNKIGTKMCEASLNKYSDYVTVLIWGVWSRKTWTSEPICLSAGALPPLAASVQTTNYGHLLDLPIEKESF